MPYTITIESFEEFSTRHGGEFYHVGAVCIWPDGAQCSFGNRDNREEPPDAPLLLKPLRRAFLDAKLKATVESFQRLQQQAVDQAQLARKYANLPPPSPDILTELRRLKMVATTIREELAELVAQAQALESQSPQRVAQQQRERQQAERLRSVNSLLGEITSLTI